MIWKETLRSGWLILTGNWAKKECQMSYESEPRRKLGDNRPTKTRTAVAFFGRSRKIADLVLNRNDDESELPDELTIDELFEVAKREFVIYGTEKINSKLCGYLQKISPKPNATWDPFYCGPDFLQFYFGGQEGEHDNKTLAELREEFENSSTGGRIPSHEEFCAVDMAPIDDTIDEHCSRCIRGEEVDCAEDREVANSSWCSGQKSERYRKTVLVIYVWPDYTWCWRVELSQMAHKSDDYMRLEVPDHVLDIDQWLQETKPQG